ncbi:MAG: hypothetical protein IJ809_03630 [Clostridia bacterium]|nr:hypothetical protein [Clostridia bacterium]
MEEQSKNRIIVLGLGVLLVAFVALWIIGNIWTSNENTSVVSQPSENEAEENVTSVEKVLGVVYNETSGQDRILREYFSDIFKVLASSDEDAIYAITSSDYLEKYNLNTSTLYKKLVNKGLVGKAFECKKYAVANNPRFGKIYSLEISSIDGSVLDRIIVIEESPRDYKISFDSYVGKRPQDISITKEGLKLQITSVEEFKDVVYFKIALENTSDNTLVLNHDRNAAEAIYLNLNKSTKIYNTKDFFASQEIVLNPGDRITTEQEFFISDLQSYKINKLVIVNVYNQASQTNENYEYSIYGE